MRIQPTLAVSLGAAVCLAACSGTLLASEFDQSFDWVVAGQIGPLFDSETGGGSLFPGDYVGQLSLERSLHILTFRTSIGGFLYGDEIPAKNRETGSFLLVSAMDRFGEGPWALYILGGAGSYEARTEVDVHAGVGFY